MGTHWDAHTHGSHTHGSHTAHTHTQTHAVTLAHARCGRYLLPCAGLGSGSRLRVMLTVLPQDSAEAPSAIRHSQVCNDSRTEPHIPPAPRVLLPAPHVVLPAPRAPSCSTCAPSCPTYAFSCPIYPPSCPTCCSLPHMCSFLSQMCSFLPPMLLPAPHAGPPSTIILWFSDLQGPFHPNHPWLFDLSGPSQPNHPTALQPIRTVPTQPPFSSTILQDPLTRYATKAR